MILLWAFFSSPLHAYDIVNESEGTDISLTGLFTHRINSTSVKGDWEIFEDSDLGLPRDYSNQTYGSFFGEGIYKKDNEVEFYATYDRETRSSLEEPLTFFGKIAREDSYLSLGDHEDGYYSDTVFTRSTESFRGMKVHYEEEDRQLSFVAAAVEGQTFQEEIRGNGTSGPYPLSEGPVIDFTESVVFLVRDKNNFNTVLSSRVLQRGVDYNMRYVDGEIYLNFVLEEQSFSGNPHFLRVTYQFKSGADLYERGAVGFRGVLPVSDSLKVGLTYMTEGDVTGDFDDFSNNRLDLITSDINFHLPNRFTLQIEHGLSGVEGEYENSGTRGEFNWTLTPQWDLYGRYWKTEEDFHPFPNTSILANHFSETRERLDPFIVESYEGDVLLDRNIDVSLALGEEAFGNVLSYHPLPYHDVELGWRHTISPQNDGTIRFDDQSTQTYLSYKTWEPDKLNVFAALEYLYFDDDLESHQTDQNLFYGLLGVKNRLGYYSFLKEVKYQTLVRYEQVEDRLNPLNSNNLTNGLLRLSSFQTEDLEVYTELQEDFLYEEQVGQTTRRTDAVALGVREKFTSVYEGDISVRHRRIENLLLDLEEMNENSVRLILDCHFSADLQGRFKLEHILRNRTPEPNEDETFRGGVYLSWKMFEALTSILEYTRESDSLQTSVYSENLSDIRSIQFNFEKSVLKIFSKYRIEEEQNDDALFGVLKTRTRTALVGLKYYFHDDWHVLMGYKDIRVSESIEEQRRKAYLELSYEWTKYFILSLGYENIDSFERNVEGVLLSEFNADVGYLKGTIKI